MSQATRGSRGGQRGSAGARHTVMVQRVVVVILVAHIVHGSSAIRPGTHMHPILMMSPDGVNSVGMVWRAIVGITVRLVHLEVGRFGVRLGTRRRRRGR